MTLDEYAQRVGDALRTAHNSKDKAALEAAFKEADAELDKLLDANRKRFWEKVRAAMNVGRWRVEDQANSSLMALMQAIQTGLAARQGK